jgi:hypothetical protein
MIFPFVVKVAFLQGVFAKSSCKTWLFGGEFVVNCVVSVVS